MMGYEDSPQIKEVITGLSVRSDDNDVTIFKSSGTAIQDVAVSALVYERAKEAGVGTRIDLSE
jgi:ornithine cyclodeaminase/alanine dehydrogenase-like protein (mu-crystallin family)